MLRPKILYASHEKPPGNIDATAARLGFTIAHTPDPRDTLHESSIAVMPIRKRSDVESTFSTARFRRRCPSVGPSIVIIDPSLCLPSSVTADFEDLGCRVTFTEEPTALAQTISLAICAESRVHKRGAIILWNEGGMPELQGIGGKPFEVRLSPGELSILKALINDGPRLMRFELADITRNTVNETQMFVRRIRAKFIRRGRQIGIELTMDSVIRTDEEGGYRLVARVRRRPSDV